MGKIAKNDSDSDDGRMQVEKPKTLRKIKKNKQKQKQNLLFKKKPVKREDPFTVSVKKTEKMAKIFKEVNEQSK
jgi:hypothetical protein